MPDEHIASVTQKSSNFSSDVIVVYYGWFHFTT